MKEKVEKDDENYFIFFAITCFGLFLRSAISLHPHSGEGKPPMFGDYEAQRHWQEICVNLPVDEWYKNTTRNNLTYWGLDYPPLTAYHSYVMGLEAKRVDPNFVALYTSRGIESDGHKLFMRSTVLLADFLMYIPAITFFVDCFYKHIRKAQNSYEELSHLAIFLAYPGQILIDNGHFQYNNISLGLTLFAVMFVCKGWNILGTIAFCLALNYKQMELYHALPFFFVLLSRSFSNQKSFFHGLFNVAKIGLTVIFCFVVIWYPWLNSVENVAQVVHRIFPLARGVFEDKVSNFWCIANVLIKLKQTFSNETMALICIVATIVLAMPSCLHLFYRPGNMQFLFCLLNTSLSFFLFSFQVHEKSILLVAVAVLSIFPAEPFMSIWFLQLSTFSMFPLLAKDKLTVAFVGLSLVFNTLTALTTYLQFGSSIHKFDVLQIQQLIQKLPPAGKTAEKFRKFLCVPYYLSTAFCYILAICHLCVKPPPMYPDLFPLAISAYSGCLFLAFFVYFNVKQFTYKE